MTSFVRRAARAAGLFGFGALAVAPAAAGAAARSTAARCPTSGTTLEQNAEVRVYSRNGDGDPVNACAFGTGRPFRIGSAGDEENPDLDDLILRRAVAGRMVAVATQNCNIDNCGTRITVYDSRSRRAIHTGPAVSPPASDFFAVPVDSLVLRRSGGVAWIGAVAESSGGSGQPRPVQVEVRKIERENTVTTVDSGLTIGTGSLALGGTRIYWLKGGAAQTAGLR